MNGTAGVRFRMCHLMEEGWVHLECITRRGTHDHQAKGVTAPMCPHRTLDGIVLRSYPEGPILLIRSMYLSTSRRRNRHWFPLLNPFR